MSEDWRIAAGIPRGSCIDLNTDEELFIREAVDLVERLGAHPMLTEVVILLGKAKDKLGEWVDAGKPGGNA